MYAVKDTTWEELCAAPIGQWVTAWTNGIPYLNIRGKDCMVSLERRLPYCDRGRWLAKVQVFDPIALSLDYHDGWKPGRYYFHFDCAQSEIMAWLQVRKQLEDD